MAMQANVTPAGFASFTQVTPTILASALKRGLRAKRPIFVWGQPGIGKSMIGNQFAADVGYGLIDIRVSQWDAVDGRGVPFVVENEDGTKTTAWAVPSIFPKDPASKVIIFLDELNSAPPSVQAGLYQLIHDRRLGDYVLPEEVYIIAAGNMESDRAVTSRMSTALAGRFSHLQLTVDHAAWERWAIDAGLHLGIISYLRWKPEHLHLWDANSTSKAQPTPRTWQFCSDLIKASEAEGGSGDAVESALICGTVGEQVGAEVVGFLPLFRNLPDPDEIIKDPMGSPLLTDPALNYGLCGALGQRANKQNFAAIVKYANRLAESRAAGPEFMVYLVRVALTKHPELYQTKTAIQWQIDNKGVFI